MLTSLQTLSKFIVKEGDGATIAELNNLNNLRGSLSIQGLENVQDAELANLKGKQGLEELELEWTGHGKNDMSVLESLEPHQNLKRLTILAYGGAEFPYWMNNISLVFLDLWNCEETKVLPPLGQLRSLKELSIHGLRAVKSIGVELYGNAVVPFPLLERLGIGYMSEWIEWSHGNMGGEVFPNLQMLSIYQCPKWRGNLPSGLHRLRRLSELRIIGCPNLVSFAPMGLPRTLKSIKVEGCNALEYFPIIDTGDGMESLLEDLDIVGCSSLNYFERYFELPISLRRLTIQDCGNLLSLPDGLMVQDDNTNPSQSQSHLEYLKIKGCQGLTSLPTGKFPAALKTLEIKECHNLRQPIAEWGLGMLSSLETLEVSGTCPATADVVSFPVDNCSWLPTSLKHLHMKDFIHLESMSMGLQMLTSLESLSIGGCPKLQSLPASLSDFIISADEN
ncbi:hypothetical protein HS088_TW16G00147 [Tripterygium wilfordii]|uniref:R13L1/DRL21-like LRR repeat region domain-containing protein n=2 Tax=Tripterygium wilfordii TaxID=458696 RepID=A0A7J7CI38_TRIWF|nr:hypothetical protein HS088_TW16G00147 [Tripterygium wilfordii]